MSNNAKRYHFADFTFDNYRELVSLTKRSHVFSNFTDFSTVDNPVLWRHDIDFSPQNALKFAQIEAEQGVVSTYFLLLHSSFYNLLDVRITEIVQEILALGHDLGLHFDCSFYNICDESHLEHCLLLEKSLLEKVFKTNIDVFSFHVTNKHTENFRNKQYAGLINVYSDFIQDQFKYCSDSNGYWRYERLYDFLLKNEEGAIQILTHPVWWSEVEMSLKERLELCIETQSDENRRYYQDVTTKFNRIFVDW